MNYLLKTHGRHDALSRMILEGGVWEPRVAEAVYSLCSRPHTAFFDIGSNIGAHTAIARLAGAEKIWCVECNPVTITQLKQTIALNHWGDRIQVIEQALSDVSGHLPFTLVTDNLGASYIPVNRPAWNGPVNATEGVDVVPLDSLSLDLSGVAHIVAKLDVEGHELQVLRGAQRLLADRRLDTILIELNPACATKEQIQKILDLLSAAGFQQASLMFQVPGHPWAGAEVGSLPPFPALTTEQILNSFSQGHIMEVMLTRAPPITSA